MTTKAHPRAFHILSSKHRIVVTETCRTPKAYGTDMKVVNIITHSGTNTTKKLNNCIHELPAGSIVQVIDQPDKLEGMTRGGIPYLILRDAHNVSISTDPKKRILLNGRVPFRKKSAIHGIVRNKTGCDLSLPVKSNFTVMAPKGYSTNTGSPIAFTDASVRNGVAACSVVTRDAIRVFRVDTKKSTTAETLALCYAIEEVDKGTVILCDCVHALTTLAGHPRVASGEVHIAKVKGHGRVFGNEVADTYAKHGAAGMEGVVPNRVTSICGVSLGA